MFWRKKNPLTKQEKSMISMFANGRHFNDVIIVNEDGIPFQEIEFGNITLTKKLDYTIKIKETDMSKKLDKFIEQNKLDPAKKKEIGESLEAYHKLGDLKRGVEVAKEKYASPEATPATPADPKEDAFGFLEEYKEPATPNAPATPNTPPAPVDPFANVDSVVDELAKLDADKD